MKVVLATLAALVATAAVAAVVYAQSEFTQCFATFDQNAARTAAADARDAGYDAQVHRSGSRRKPPSAERRLSVTFSDGETGADAREFRRTFRELVRRGQGARAHPGGCLERPHFN